MKAQRFYQYAVAKYPQSTARIARALVYYRQGRVTQLAPNRYTVRGSHTYDVDLETHTCTCIDAVEGKAPQVALTATGQLVYGCKHWFAAIMARIGLE